MSSKDKQEKLKKYDDYINHLHRFSMGIGALRTVVGVSGTFNALSNYNVQRVLNDADEGIAAELKEMLYEKHGLERYE